MSLKKNFFYSSILTIANYIFPLITFPYVSRILGVSNIGKCNFVDSIVSYFVLFATMGLAVIGVREIAKSKALGGEETLSKTFSSLFVLNILFTIVSLIIFFLVIFFDSDLKNYNNLLYIGGAKILFTLFLIEWFYKGIENFRYITVRSILIKVIYILLIFLLVKKPDDYEMYYLLTVCMVLVNGIFNIIYSRNFIRISFLDLKLKKYLAPVLKAGVYALLTSMYTTFNVVYLGFVSTEAEVGYYTTAIKLYTIILAVFTAFTGVIMPRVSVLIEEKKMNHIISILDKSFNVLFLFCFPIIAITLVLTPQIIFLIAGLGYEHAIVPMRIIMPLVLVVGIAQIYVIQILMPFKHDNYVLYNAISGAVVGLILNIVLVKNFASVGSAIVILVSELTVLFCAVYFSRGILKLSFPYKKILINASLSVPYLFLCWFSQYFFQNPVYICLVSIILGLLYFLVSQVFILKNELCVNLYKFFLNKIR